MGKRLFTAEQAREAMIAAGVAKLREAGPADVVSVSLATAITDSGVPRPSGYRVFGSGDSDPQQAFREEVVLSVIGMDPGPSAKAVRESIGSILEEARGLDGDCSSEQLTGLLHAAICKAAETVVTRGVNDPVIGTFLSAIAMLTEDAKSDRVAAAVAATRANRESGFCEANQDLLSTFGLRMRKNWTAGSAYSVLADSSFGAILSAKTAQTPDAIARSSAWLAASYAALVSLFAEADPKFVVAAQPQMLLSLVNAEGLAAAQD